MKTRLTLTVAVAVLVAAKFSTVPAATFYVSPASPNPTPPYTNWATAARVIQDAVDAAAPGDEIVVTNGIYGTGGRAVGTNLLANRVAVGKALTLRSVNGPQFTIIQGAKAPAGGNGEGAIRCVYLTEGASLSGFALTNGATRRTVGDFQNYEDSGAGLWCESTNAVVSNCVVVGNSARTWGGGAYGGTLNNCTLSGNSAAFFGGGAAYATLNNCVLSGNSAAEGGGATEGRLNNCVLTGNSAGNGGGAAWSSLNNCTVTGNSAGGGGGVYQGTLNNCIVYYNTAQSAANYDADLNYCCTTPLPPGGVGNIDLDPQLASASHLSAGSPCRAAGSATFATGTDIDGEAWAPVPSIGCDEYHVGAATGPLNVRIVAVFTNVAAGYPVRLTALIEGRTTASRWEFGDGLVEDNQPYPSHVWAAAGEYAVVLRAYNESHPEGVSAAVTVHVVAQPVHYVAADGLNPLPPYTSWVTAATNIQDAVDAAFAGGTILVTNGIYATGGRAMGSDLLANRVAVDKPIALRSVNGPQFTIIQGAKTPGGDNGEGAIRCVYLAEGASLSGFTLTNGATRIESDYARENRGGGVWCESTNAAVTNSVMVGNSAEDGGGAAEATLYDCTLIGNSAHAQGGGACWSTLHNCAVTANSAAFFGGGACYSTLFQCGLTDNSTAYDGGGAEGGTLYNCTLTGNSAHGQGGGADRGTLYNCTLTGNSAESGGGAAGSTLYNSTVTGNSAERSGGVAAGVGAYANIIESRLYNCIVCFNRAPNGANYSAEWTTLAYSCTTPLPPGPGNIEADPRLASATHLSTTSPCIGAGSPAYTSGVDIDGEPWANPPAMGADQPGPATGPLTVSIEASLTSVASGYTVSFTAFNTGPILQSVWDFGDGALLTNQPFASHAWTAPGAYTVRLTGYNDSYPGGVTASVVMTVSAGVHYVSQASANPVFPYTSWETAATNIQDAIGAAPQAGGLVLVTDGVYRVGTVERNGLNRVALTNVVTVRSVNGSAATVLQGETTGVRCAYVGDGSVLSGLTLTKGTAVGGGGVWCEASGVVTNCVLTANSATGDGASGGGALGGTLNNCTLSSNRSGYYGGGASGSTLTDCTLTGNSSAICGGGASGGTLYNCLLKNNSADASGGGAIDSTLDRCTLTGNRSGNGGGGAYGSKLTNCKVTGNSGNWGGGAGDSTLYNCTVTGNSGGGVFGGTLYNCIVYLNPSGGNYAVTEWNTPSLNHCCTTPMPSNGFGNITNAPLFVDYANGNFRLQSNSPCINAGLNDCAPGPTDLDGNPRIVSGTVDLGAYEFQGPGSVISYAWLQRYGLPTDGSADFTDPDGDGLNNWQEWRCQTDPTNALSALRLVSASRAGADVTVTWQSVAGVSYFLERSTDLGASPRFTLLATNLLGQAGTTTYTDTNTVVAPRLFYRVGAGL